MNAPDFSSSPASASDNEPNQEQRAEPQQEQDSNKDLMHKAKTIQFLGRSTPVIIQNDNGPCPLLAICNVLLLRNNLNLSPDISEVSQEKLLSLVAERLIDSNSNVNDKDAGYVENQQQNIADAIDLLPRLATGIDVNIKYRRIDDFEFTRECAIFDLLDIPLYHGWIVDPQDYETANAIGSKSYNTLMGELVALETQKMEDSRTKNSEDCVDFVAATTATLGVPSPCLSKARSFSESPCANSDSPTVRKGDLQEEAELLRVLKLSEAENAASAAESLEKNIDSLDEMASSKNLACINSVNADERNNGALSPNLPQSEPAIPSNWDALRNDHCDAGGIETSHVDEIYSSSRTEGFNFVDQSSHMELGNHVRSNDGADESSAETVSVEKNASEQVRDLRTMDSVTLLDEGAGFLRVVEKPDMQNFNGFDVAEPSSVSLCNTKSDLLSGRSQQKIASEAFGSCLDGSEPMYEGEECVLDSECKVYEDREPVYEGETVLAEQADKSTTDACSEMPKSKITPQQGEMIRNFLKNSASQLTVYGLFCLQDGLKERELCIFFRNNHFSTMFKYEGELYLLATDQGYLNQPDLVWEKLDEVNGDTLFMTSEFKEFKMDSHASGTWDEQNAMANTADYIASIDAAAQADINSDLELAIALQQQEFGQRQQQSQGQGQGQGQGLQQIPLGANSGLVVGPQGGSSGRSSSSSTPKADSKLKEKCIVM